MARALARLEVFDPSLVPLLHRELPRARQIVARQLVAAALREGLADPRRHVAERHGFDRWEPSTPIDADPAALLDRLTATPQPAVREELADATVNLALALARRSLVERELLERARAAAAPDMVALTAELDPDERTIAFERLAVTGHNLHPCARTRLGWDVPDVLAHDLESPVTSVGFLAVRRDLHVGDEVAGHLVGDLERALAAARVDPRRFVVTPVHPWQRRHVLGGRYADLYADGALVPLDLDVPALVTAALRTLLVPSAARFVKLSLDIQVTSTRRTISVASTRNGPTLSRLLPELIADDRVVLLTEPAGSAVVAPACPPGAARERDLATIVRCGLSGRLPGGEVAVPGTALPARDPLTGATVLAGLVDRSGLSAPAFVTRYAQVLLPPVLRLATRHGIGLEAHLQNCILTFVDGVPHRLVLRDLAGLRVHTPRLARSRPVVFWPGSATVTGDADVMLAKVSYTALQAHLGEVILQLAASHGLDEAAAWSAVRSVVDDVYAELAAEPGLTDQARADHAYFTAPTAPHKALLTMRLRAVAGQPGDHYVPVTNPLWQPR
ncbi:MAG: RhbF-like rhizobactin siderophore biosynthesis protein [Dactylosporangium sp.]|nr:RhbF-like rhizobactin siderophore biosynthesis protein [Dactylosporangium sp.]